MKLIKHGGTKAFSSPEPPVPLSRRGLRTRERRLWGREWNKGGTRRKTSRSRVENQQTQPTYDAKPGNRTRATLVGGECSRHMHCANPAPKTQELMGRKKINEGDQTLARPIENSIYLYIFRDCIDCLRRRLTLAHPYHAHHSCSMSSQSRLLYVLLGTILEGVQKACRKLLISRLEPIK